MIMFTSLGVLVFAAILSEAAFISDKNKTSTLFQKLVVFMCAGITYALVGFGLSEGKLMLGITSAFSESGTISANLLQGVMVSVLIGMFATNSIAERAQNLVYGGLALVVGIIIEPALNILLQPNALLTKMGFLDNQTISIQLAIAVIAFVSANQIGARLGKYQNDTVNALPSSNLYLIIFSVLLSWIGWPLFVQIVLEQRELADLHTKFFFVILLIPAINFFVALLISKIHYHYVDVVLVMHATSLGIISSASVGTQTNIVALIATNILSVPLLFWFIEWLDKKAKIDDPSSIIAIFGISSLQVLILKMLFSNVSTSLGNNKLQWFIGSIVGYILLAIFVSVIAYISLKVISYSSRGTRLSTMEETVGKDSSIFHLPANFQGLPAVNYSKVPVMEQVDVEQVKTTLTVEEQDNPNKQFTDSSNTSTIRKFEILTNPNRFDRLVEELNAIGVAGMNVSNVTGFGVQKGHSSYYRGLEVDTNFLPKIKLEVVVNTISTTDMLQAIQRALYTGHVGDGKVFISTINHVIRVSTGEHDSQALEYE
ncbi:ammonium transporter family protein [uncultured Enterococcus sp.]|uniref:ammonium transporter family protein n=1 Tax=uncultured Enterococcus sp. TaxID=167972 RepID=UPI002593D988|nr:ammonium transporter family protein [uncultured Enterococcus sp.]